MSREVRTKMAWINWSKVENAWVLRLWDDDYEEWELSRMWRVKDDVLVHDSILCEIARLQELGWTVKVTA